MDGPIIHRLPIQSIFEIRGVQVELNEFSTQLGFSPNVESSRIQTIALMQWLQVGPKRAFIKSTIDEESSLELKLAKLTDGKHISCVNVSDGYCGLGLVGDDIFSVMNQVVSINLHQFQPESVVATEVFELSGILLQHNQNSYEIYIARSYTEYVTSRIKQIMQ